MTERIGRCLKYLPSPGCLPDQSDPCIGFSHLKRRRRRCRWLMVYIRSTWLASQWEPRQWSVFDRDVMINNALEGWHHRLNNLTEHGHVNFYNFIHLLYTEARAVKGELCQ